MLRHRIFEKFVIFVVFSTWSQALAPDTSIIPFEGQISANSLILNKKICTGDTVIYRAILSWDGSNENFMIWPPEIPETERLEFLYMQTTNQKKSTDKDTKGYKAFKKGMKPGNYVKMYRENLNLTQQALGEKIQMRRAFICDIEKNRRSISKAVAKKFAQIFDAPVDRFI